MFVDGFNKIFRMKLSLTWLQPIFPFADTVIITEPASISAPLGVYIGFKVPLFEKVPLPELVQFKEV